MLFDTFYLLLILMMPVLSHLTIQFVSFLLGLGYNFDKYGKDITSTMGTPYDYWSVMHYSQNAFSSNKGRTIITKDARFQDVIGQHLEMSSYDALELNRQYNCSKSSPDQSQYSS